MIDWIWWHWVINGNFNDKRMRYFYWYEKTKSLTKTIESVQKNRERFERLENKYK